MSNTFKAVLPRAEHLKKLIDALGHITQNISLYISENGISAQAMDTAHVCMVSLEADAGKVFDTYKCTGPIVLTIPLGSMARVLKMADNDDTVTLSWTCDSADELVLNYTNKDQSRECEFKLKLLDLEHDRLDACDPADGDEGYWEVIMSASEFAGACRDLSSIGGDYISIEPVTGKDSKLGPMKLETVSVDVGKAQLIISAVVKSAPDGVAPIRMPIRYLVSITKGHSLAQDVRLCMAERTPLLLSLDTPMGSLKYYVAPCFEDDDYEQAAHTE